MELLNSGDRLMEAFVSGIFPFLVSIEIILDRDKYVTARIILTYVYYWYNFVPLARDTAACGYTAILLFWVAGMPITVGIPKDYQVDWEAILEPHADIFIGTLYKWMVPDAVRPSELRGHTLPVRSKCRREIKQGSSRDPLMWHELPNLGDLPRVSSLLDRTRKRLESLNGVTS